MSDSKGHSVLFVSKQTLATGSAWQEIAKDREHKRKEATILGKVHGDHELKKDEEAEQIALSALQQKIHALKKSEEHDEDKHEHQSRLHQAQHHNKPPVEEKEEKRNYYDGNASDDEDALPQSLRNKFSNYDQDE
jgi:hypothetical protein